MERTRRLSWWIAVPAGLALGLALALGLDGAAAPAGAQAGGSGITLSAEQLRINQRIAQQGVRRANRANARLDALRPAAAGPQGPPGPAGPAGPGATRIAYSAAAGTVAEPALQVEGVTILTACQANAGGVELVITAQVAQPTSFTGSVAVDAGTDPSNPGPTDVQVFRSDLPAGTSPLGTVPGADGQYVRVVADAILATPSRTLNVTIVEMADGIADRCSFEGLAVTS